MKNVTIFGNGKNKAVVETAAQIIFTICAFFAVLAVVSITLYMIVSGTPAIAKVGLKEILFDTVWKPTAEEPHFGILYVILTSVVGTSLAILIGVPIGVLTAVFIAEVAPVWKPTAEEPHFGILYVILTSVVGTSLAILIGVPIGVLTAVFIAEVAPRKLAAAVRPAVELLAGIPSVIYGLLGIYLLNPFMYKIELALFKNSETHQFTGGANLISAVLVLAIMILPTVINISATALQAVQPSLKSASLALGASHMQTVFRIMLPAAKSGIVTAVVLGVGRAIGEAMAITLVSGSSVNIPLPFNSVRFLTTAIVSEMGYSSGTHRQVLFTIGAMAITLVSGSSVNIPLPFNSVRFLTTAIVSEMGYSSGTHRQVLFTIGLVLFAFIMVINVALNKILKKGAKADE